MSVKVSSWKVRFPAFTAILGIAYFGKIMYIVWILIRISIQVWTNQQDIVFINWISIASFIFVIISNFSDLKFSVLFYGFIYLCKRKANCFFFVFIYSTFLFRFHRFQRRWLSFFTFGRNLARCIWIDQAKILSS